MCFGLSRRSRSLKEKLAERRPPHDGLGSLQRGIKGVDFGHGCGMVVMFDVV